MEKTKAVVLLDYFGTLEVMSETQVRTLLRRLVSRLHEETLYAVCTDAPEYFVRGEITERFGMMEPLAGVVSICPSLRPITRGVFDFARPGKNPLTSEILGAAVMERPLVLLDDRNDIGWNKLFLIKQAWPDATGKLPRKMVKMPRNVTVDDRLLRKLAARMIEASLATNSF